jgi:exo-beta-1,3-glucanase (GH17 family)
MKQISGGVGAIKIYGNTPNIPEVLAAARTAHLQVALGTTNDQINTFQQASAAESYVDGTVCPYADVIKLLIIGNEVDFKDSGANFGAIVPAMTNVERALQDDGLNIPVTTTTLTTSTIKSYPPACSEFDPAYRQNESALFSHLASRGSFVLVDIYPYITFRNDQQSGQNHISLDYALGKQSVDITDPGDCGAAPVTEPSLFRAQYDAYKAAVKDLGYASVPVYIGEIGWAHHGSLVKDSQGNLIASPKNQADFIHNYTNYVKANNIPSFLFEMYDENLKPAPPDAPDLQDEKYYGIWPHAWKP